MVELRDGLRFALRETGQDTAPQYPPPSENPYGQPPADGDADHPPRDYPGR